MRLRFILGLIILAVALQFIGKTLRGVLPMVNEAAQYPVSRQVLHRTEKHSAKNPPVQTVPAAKPFWEKSTQSLQQKWKEIKPVKKAQPDPKTEEGTNKPENAFMQITLEDLRPPIKNKALGEEASARLDTFLTNKREKNAKLAEETRILFGKQAQKEVLAVLINDERASLDNARKATAPADYAARQEKTDRNTSAKLTAVFEKHKKQFNRRLNESTPEWNEFFKRVNDFQKAAD